MVPTRSILRLSTTVAALGLACSSWSPPIPPPASPLPPPPPTPRAAEPISPAAALAARFATMRERIVDQWLAYQPALGRRLGLHEHDGRIADYSAQGIATRIEWLGKAKAALARIEQKQLSPDDALDHAILTGQVDLALFQLVDLGEQRRRPQFYEELFAVNAYVDRDYAPLAERASKLLAHEKAALAAVAHIRKNLESPMSKPVLETAIKIYKGFAEYLRGDVAKAMGGAGDAAFKDDFKKTNEALAKEAEALAKHLEKVELPKGDASHVLGAERYKKLLLAQEGLSIPLDEFEKMGEDDLARNKKAYEALAPKAKLSRPPAAKLLAEATRLMDASRAFVIDKKIVTVPTDDRALLKETPPYMRWNAAFLDAPGPFEPAKGVPAFYYMTMPDKSWPKKEQAEYVMPLGILQATTVHEVYPGHFLQDLWSRKAPTRVQKILGSYSFSEGWAHYAEQLMVEEGFGADDPQNKLGQLADALLRNCRFVVSIGVHTKGMTLEAAEKRFRNDCFQDKATAREQAVRSTFDPGYFAYTLGKVQILALREEAKKRLGDRFELRRFHDALLAHGTPPVALVRERVLADLEHSP